MTTVVYLAPADIQVARVERQMAVYFCSALAECGASVELVALGITLADAEKHRSEDPLALYAVKTRFQVNKVETRLHQDSPSWRVGFTRLRVHTVAVSRRLSRMPPGETLTVYVKNYLPGLVLLGLRQLRRFTLLFEVHTTPRNALQRFVLRHVDGVVANTHALAKTFVVVAMPLGCCLRTKVSISSVSKQARRSTRSASGSACQRADSSRCTQARSMLVTGRWSRLSPPRRRLTVGTSCSSSWEGERMPLRRGGARWRGGDSTTSPLSASYLPAKCTSTNSRPMCLSSTTRPTSRRARICRQASSLATWLREYRLSQLTSLSSERSLGDPPAAILIPPDSRADLAAAVRRVVDDPQLSASTAAAALERVKEFTWTRRAELVLGFIEQLEAARDEKQVRPQRGRRSQGTRPRG